MESICACRQRARRQTLIAGSEENSAPTSWGYAAQKDGGCVDIQVEHPSWRVWQVSERFLHCDVALLYGEKYVEALGAKPVPHS